ncbi:MAG: helix-turn-helix transcriptional regulator [Desulfuromonadales bacterium]|nr:helix-turn-helix transcriptional regulator [Desulfuromonadales bacterium]
MNDLNIGAKIKKLRQGKKLTLQTVADKIGFSPALISQIENNNVSPPIATLSKIASFFEVKIGMFFVEDENENRFEVVHANERKPITKTFTPVDNACGYSCESLSFRMHNKKMEPFLLTVNESSLEEATYSHTGEKFLFITKGNVELILDNKHILLSQGDSIYFDSTIKHRLVSKDNNVEVLTVIAR